MRSTDRPRVGYVMKMYPRLSETFILNEILAHESAELKLDIFSLRPPIDSRFHQDLGRVAAEVTYLARHSGKSREFWSVLCKAHRELPGAGDILKLGQVERAADLYQAILLANEVQERGISHLHAHFATLATTAARIAARLTGITYSFTAHAKDIYHNDIDEEDLRRKLRDAAAVVTVSAYNRAHLRDRFGDDASRVQRIYNGLDLEQFAYCPPVGRERLILGIGRLVEKKAFADLISACAVLDGRGHEFLCEIIGDGVLREDLARKISELGVSHRIKMLGQQPRVEVRRHLSRAAMLAVPCIISPDGNRDGLPTVLLEAMAVGTPCVSTNVTGIPELVRDGETGLLAEQHDPESLADQLERLLEDERLRLRLARNARRLVEAEFDIHRNTPALRQIFLTACRNAKVAMDVG